MLEPEEGEEEGEGPPPEEGGEEGEGPPPEDAEAEEPPAEEVWNVYSLSIYLSYLL